MQLNPVVMLGGPFYSPDMQRRFAMPSSQIGLLAGLLFCVPVDLPGAAEERELPLLTTTVQVKQLQQGEAEKSYPVRIRGVVTYINSSANIAFVQDGTGGTMFVPRDPDSTTPAPLQRGKHVEVNGVTAPSTFTPIIAGLSNQAASVKQLHDLRMPPAQHLESDELGNPVHDSAWVQLKGVVREIEPADEEFGPGHYEMIVSTADDSLRAIIPASSEKSATSLLGAVVTMRGVYDVIATQFGKRLGLRLLVQDFSDISIESPGVASFVDLPLKPLKSILKFESGTTIRARVKGVVTLDAPGRGFYLQNEGGWLWVDADQRRPVWAGQVVEVVGFPSNAKGYPMLQNSVFQVLGSTLLPRPISITSRAALLAGYHGARVTIRATVIDRLSQPGYQTLVVQADDEIFQARLIRSGEAPPVELPEEQSLVDITGICVNDFRRERVLDPETDKPFRSISFHLLVHDFHDVKLVEPPPFWTTKKVTGALIGLGAALSITLAWVLSLRRQVIRQTALIEDKMARETVMEERTRIARELHDSLEQELSGIQMQLDAASDHINRSPEFALETLNMARSLLKHSRTETRRSVWDLRSTALESGSLESAFQEVINMMNEEKRAPINISSSGTMMKLPTSVENNMLRIGQEAVNNAIDHASADAINISLTYQSDCVTLRVQDDGDGFDVKQAPTSLNGHYGITGMRERARKIGGQIEIQSEIGTGSQIELSVPYAEPQSNEEEKEQQEHER